MKSFVLYTLARAGLFVAVFSAMWLALAGRVEWNSVSILYTTLIALVISSIIALFTLRSLRDKLAAEVAGRASRAQESFQARKSGEDADPH